MGQLSGAGFKRLALVTEVEQGLKRVKVNIDKTLAASVALHVLVIGWGLVSFSTKAFETTPEKIPAGRHHFRRSACSRHCRHEDRQEGKSKAAGREGR